MSGPLRCLTAATICGDHGWHADVAGHLALGKKVKLSKEIRAYYDGKSCGDSCTPPQTQWVHEGVISIGENDMLRRVASGLILAVLALMPGFAVAVEQSGDAKEEGDTLCPGAETQFELNECAAKEHAEVDAKLNRVYQEILKRYKDDPVFIKKLRESQRAWLKYRDAQFEARYPHILDRRGQYNYGSVFPMCAGLYKAELTQSRVEELQAWLDGVEEGEVCAGSLPLKDETP